MKLSISSAVAAYVRPGSSVEVRLAGFSAAEGMADGDRLLLLFCLSKDTEPAIRSLAVSLLKALPESIVNGYRESPDANPIVLKAISGLFLADPAISEESTEESVDASDDEPEELSGETDPDGEQVVEESEEFLSKYKTAQIMGIAEKIKMALSGDKEWRSILVKDSNKLVSGSVIKNPRITEGEILTLVKSGSPNDEIMRLICSNKEWVKSYKLRKALIENNRTLVPNALRYLATMGDKDLASFAKSKNVASVISTM
ncbi:MAG: hypothetical protein PHU01_15485, partial [Desulfuromonadaceae bacterium]|nr:hypothetical protein [Desulfuromonadaceae bacterium]